MSLNKRKALFLSFLFFVGMIILINYQYHIARDIHIEKDKNKALKELVVVSSKIKESINKHLYLLSSLTSFIKANPNFMDNDFLLYSNIINESKENIIDITLAPNNVIEYAYPFSRLAYASGIHIINDKNKEFIESKIKEKNPFIIGPLTIPPKIEVLLFSSPVYVHDWYWGLANITVEYKKFFDKLGFIGHTDEYDLAIRTKEKDGYKIMMGEAKVFENNDKDFILPINIYSTNWEVGLRFNENYQLDDPLWLKYLGMLGAMFVSFLIYKTIQTKDELENVNKRMEKYIEIVDEFVITSSTDLEGNITYASKAFCDISGYRPKEIIGKSHNILKHPDMPQHIFDELWFCITHGRVWKGEIKNKKKNGDSYWVHSSISPIYENGHKVGYTSIRHDITDKKRIEEISITDALTELYNRRYFNDMFTKLINSARRDDKNITFIILDVDHFKQYNDTYGHHEGDNVLKNISTILKATLKRATDYCFRLGGEEFGVIIVGLDEKNSFEICERLRAAIESLQIAHEKNSVSKYVTSSFGMVVKNAYKVNDQDEIFKEADDLLYKAKESGRNKICTNFKTNPIVLNVSNKGREVPKRL